VNRAMAHAAGRDRAAQVADCGNPGSDHTRFYTQRG
jgi:hypothetical protein